MKYGTWPTPKKILLHTYDRANHLIESLEKGLVGVPDDGSAAASKANQIGVDDWVLLRLTEYKALASHLLLAPALRVCRPPFLQGKGRGVDKDCPPLFWERERAENRVLYPFRIPVTWLDTPFSGLEIRFDDLARSGFRSRQGRLLESPAQWGIKFSCSIVDTPHEIRKMLELLEAHATPRARQVSDRD